MSSRAHSLRPVVEELLRPGLSLSDYAAALRDLNTHHRLGTADWRELLESGLPRDPLARRALYADLVERGADVVPLLVFDEDHVLEAICGPALNRRACSLRESFRGMDHGEPTGLPCMRCGEATLERLAEHATDEWTEVDLRCSLCGAMHLGYSDGSMPTIDLVLLDNPRSSAAPPSAPPGSPPGAPPSAPPSAPPVDRATAP